MALATKQKRTTIQSKKRNAQHHQRGKHYLKTYWPYIPMLLIVSAGILVSNAWGHQGVLGAKSDFSSQILLNVTNQNRAANHEADLNVDPKLQAAAQAKANDMVAHDYWAHNTPDGKAPWTFITAAGYQYQSAGENLAYGFTDATSTVTGWMNSAEHRANILDSSYQNVGFGVASSPNYLNKGPATIVVAEYAQPISDVANITFKVSTPGANQVKTSQINGGTLQEPSAQLVSRVALLSDGQATWAVAAVSALSGAAIALFVLRHGLHLRKLILEGEHFIMAHPMFDIALVFIGTAGVVLSQAAGFTR